MFDDPLLIVELCPAASLRISLQQVWDGYCLVQSLAEAKEYLKKKKVSGVILYGDGKSIFDRDVPRLSRAFFDTVTVPLLGIRSGGRYMAHHLGGTVLQGSCQGPTPLYLYRDKTILLNGFPRDDTELWLEHEDTIPLYRGAGLTRFQRQRPLLPEGFEKVAITASEEAPREITMFMNRKKRWYGVEIQPDGEIFERGGACLLEQFARLCTGEARELPKKYDEEDRRYVRLSLKESQ